MKLADEIKAMGERLNELFPGKLVDLSVTNNSITMQIWNPGTYKQAEALLRAMGVAKREKKPAASDDMTWTVLKGVGKHAINVLSYPSGLPPSCRKETYIEKIPKTQTVETDEFIEVERTRIVCGGKVTAV